jgi:hypothetical protein
MKRVGLYAMLALLSAVRPAAAGAELAGGRLVYELLVEGMKNQSKPAESRQASDRYSDRELCAIGRVVKYELAPGAADKEGVRAVSDTGSELFGPAILGATNNGVSASGCGANMAFPRRVHVTWRKNTTPGLYWTTGTVVGDYTVHVRGRIPDAVFEYAAAEPGRAVVLSFRLQDDGVQFAWEVQERYPQGGFFYTNHGGDF